MIDLIIVAAGSGKRMNSTSNKQFIELDSIPIIAHTLKKFYKKHDIDRITMAIRPQDESQMKYILDKYGYDEVHLVHGGRERQDSIYNCLTYISSLEKHDDEDHLVLVHDGARPFVDDDTIRTCIDETRLYRAICHGVPVKDTIKLVDSNGSIISTPNRNSLWAAQTPQVFDFNLLMMAYKNAYDNNLSMTDDASMVEALGHRVKIVMGSYENIKITTPEDLVYARNLAKKY